MLDFTFVKFNLLFLSNAELLPPKTQVQLLV